jgi:hypothetical protein
MRCIAGHLLEGLHDHGFDQVVGDRADRSRTRVICQPVEASSEEATAPFPHRLLGRVEFGCNDLVVEALGTSENDTAAKSQGLR